MSCWRSARALRTWWFARRSIGFRWCWTWSMSIRPSGPRLRPRARRRGRGSTRERPGRSRRSRFRSRGARSRRRSRRTRSATHFRPWCPERGSRSCRTASTRRRCGRPRNRAASETVVFCGVMNYPPNEEGAIWMAQEVWPLVRQARPDGKAGARRLLPHAAGPAAGQRCRAA